jgi:hypothetical protein
VAGIIFCIHRFICEEYYESLGASAAGIIFCKVLISVYIASPIYVVNMPAIKNRQFREYIWIF